TLGADLASRGVQYAFPGTAFTRFVSKGDPTGSIRFSAELTGVHPRSWSLEVRRRRDDDYFVQDQLNQGDEVIAKHTLGELIVRNQSALPWPDTRETLCSFAGNPGGAAQQVRLPQWSDIALSIRNALSPIRIVSLNPRAIASPTPVGAAVQIDGGG